jgi:hypothetical protein
LVALSGCAGSPATRLLHTPNPGVRPAAHIDSIHDYDIAVATIAAVMERDFNFRPFPVVFHFAADRRGFRAALVEAGYSDAMASSTAERMDAVGGYRRVLLNEAAIARQPWPIRVASLAHEVAHSLQYELGGGQRGESDQWLREGFAEWMSMQILDRLRGIRYSEARRRYALQVRRSRATMPPLSAMATFPQWVEVNGNQEIAPYALAFLSVDFLVERHGLPAVIDYFSRFARTQDRHGNFRAAFGEDLETFEVAVHEHLW